MIRRLQRCGNRPVWLCELPGRNILFNAFNPPCEAALGFNRDTRMVWIAPDAAFNMPIEDLSVKNNYYQIANSSKTAFDGGAKPIVFMPQYWCDFRTDIVPNNIYGLTDLRTHFNLAADNPALELGQILYHVDEYGLTAVYTENGFIPAVSDTVAIIQTRSGSIEVDEGVKHINLHFIGKPPTKVYLPDSCVSCYIPPGLKIKLSIGNALAEYWSYWSAVWGKPYVVPSGFTSTPDGLVAVRKSK